MACREFVVVPALPFGSVSEGLKNRPSGISISDTGDESSRKFGGCVLGQLDHFRETREAEIRQPRPDKVPFAPRFQAPHIELSFARWQQPTVAPFVGLLLKHLDHRFRKKVQSGLTITRNKGVHVDEMLESLQQMFCGTGDDHAGITVANKNHLLKIFSCDDRDYVFNMRVQAYRR
jgi:hypothetical protein